MLDPNLAELPSQRRPSQLATNGRGLLLLEFVADAYGHHADPDGCGKWVWFELVIEPDGVCIKGEEAARTEVGERARART